MDLGTFINKLFHCQEVSSFKLSKENLVKTSVNLKD